LQEAHDSPIGGHFGVNKILAKIRKRFFWATCKQDVEEWYRICKVCIVKKDPAGKKKSPLPLILEHHSREFKYFWSTSKNQVWKKILARCRREAFIGAYNWTRCNCTPCY